MNVIFDKLARLELDDAVEFYELAVAHSHRRPNYWIDRILDDS